ncbi:hypothetical protein C8Q80DRAFT_916695 [Daedaleopsis nitida]|nr:hypothetical protein C8Q80DRAFT_916695 [Daedaleopsis nitida]
MPSDYFEAVMLAQLWTDGTLLNTSLWYCGCVHTLNVFYAQDAPFFRALLEQLEGQRPIFPSLERISWLPKPVSDLSCLPLFNKSLRQVFLDYPFMNIAPATLVEASTLGAVVSHLRQHSPFLECLLIEAFLKSGDAVSSDAISTVASFRNLQRVCIPGFMSLSSFRILVSNPSLARVDSVGVLLDDTPVAHKRITAHGLRDIDITGSGECLTELFKSLHAPRLQRAQIDTSDWAAPVVPDYVSCVAAFAAAVDKDTLDWLHMELGASSSGPSTHTVTDLVTLLGPLLPCRQLAHFYLGSCMLNLAAEDDDFDDITGAWPKLEAFTLAISDFSLRSDGAIPTAAVLRSFWRDCPALCELTLPHIDLSLCTVPDQWVRGRRRALGAPAHDLVHRPDPVLGAGVRRRAGGRGDGALCRLHRGPLPRAGLRPERPLELSP